MWPIMSCSEIFMFDLSTKSWKNTCQTFAKYCSSYSTAPSEINDNEKFSVCVKGPIVMVFY